jgi:hypothetical protein
MNAVRKIGILLLATLLMGVSVAAPLLDRGYSMGADVHVELPDASASLHPGQHNHAFCAVIASTHGLPSVNPSHSVTGSQESRVAAIHSEETALTHFASVLHSRAPPVI